MGVPTNGWSRILCIYILHTSFTVGTARKLHRHTAGIGALLTKGVFRPPLPSSCWRDHRSLDHSNIQLLYRVWVKSICSPHITYLTQSMKAGTLQGRASQSDRSVSVLHSITSFRINLNICLVQAAKTGSEAKVKGTGSTWHVQSLSDISSLSTWALEGFFTYDWCLLGAGKKPSWQPKHSSSNVPLLVVALLQQVSRIGFRLGKHLEETSAVRRVIWRNYPPSNCYGAWKWTPLQGYSHLPPTVFRVHVNLQEHCWHLMISKMCWIM